MPLLYTLPQRPPPAVSTENLTAGQAGPSAVSTLGAQGFVICFPCVSPHTLPHSLTAQSSPTPSRDRPTHRGECWQGSCVHLPQSWLPAWRGLLWTPLPLYKVGTILPLWTRNLQAKAHPVCQDHTETSSSVATTATLKFLMLYVPARPQATYTRGRPPTTTQDRDHSSCLVGRNWGTES